MEERSPRRTAKIVVIGDSGSGKSCLHQRYMSDTFSREYKCTLGCSYQAKTLKVEGVDISLQLWDTAGQERFRSLAASFFRGADGCILACSTADPDSVSNLAGWFNDFCERCPVNDEDVQEFCWAAVECKIDLDSLLKPGQIEKALRKLVRPAGSGASTAPSSPTTARKSIGPDAPSYANATSGRKKDDEGLIAQCVNRSHASQAPSTDRLEINHPFSPPSEATSSRHQPSTLSLTGTFTTARTDASTSSIYHTPSSSVHDTDSVASESTITPGDLSDEEHRPDFHSDEEEDHYAYQDQEEVFAQAGRESRKHGIDPYMTSSPPRAPPSLGRKSNLKVIYSGGPSTVPFDADDAPVNLAQTVSRRIATKGEALAHDYAQDGIKLFRTSAKTGEGVDELFEYVAKRVLWKWKKEEEREAREQRELGVGSYQEVIRVGQDGKERRKGGWKAACCA